MEQFNFEKLEVWQKAVGYADDVISLLEQIETKRNHYRLFEQMESACTSISMNIAEGRGRFSKREFIHFLHIARGSLFETVTLLTIFRKREWIGHPEFQSLKENSFEIGKMINGLIKAVRN